LFLHFAYFHSNADADAAGAHGPAVFQKGATQLPISFVLSSLFGAIVIFLNSVKELSFSGT
jgi:hypothetical protein